MKKNHLFCNLLENIIFLHSFLCFFTVSCSRSPHYVHLDETNVHAHCTLIPLAQEKNRISWRSIFGQNRHEMGQLFSQLHDEFSKEVGMKWGLERGDSIRETGARH